MAGKRKPISKTTRFEIFKRDQFACQYCGATPPAVILQVDHIVPVKNGGDNQIENLITSCQACNSGKGCRPLDSVPETVASRIEALEERQEQIKAYERMLRANKARETRNINKVVAILEDSLGGNLWVSDASRRSIRTFLKNLPCIEVSEAMETAVNKFIEGNGLINSLSTGQNAFKYFCGICWKKIKEGRR